MSEPKRPLVYWCLAALAALTMLNLNGVVVMGTGFGQAFSSVMLLLCLSIIVGCGINPWRDLGGTGVAFFAALAVYLAIGIGLHANAEAAPRFLSRLYSLGAAALTIYAAAAATRHATCAYPLLKLLRLLAVLGLTAVAAIFVGILWPGLYDLLPRSHEVRHSGLFANPNEAGGVVALVAAFCFGCLQVARHRWFYVAGLCLCGLATIVTFSRTSMAMFAALVVVQLLMSSLRRDSKRQPGRRWSSVVASLIAGSAFFWFLFGGLAMWAELDSMQQKRLDSVSDLATLQSGEVLNDRLAIFRLGVERWMESPIFGSGLGSSFNLRIQPGNGGIGPHNTWLLLLIEGGIVSAAAFLIFAVVWFRAAWKCPLPAVRAVAIGVFVVFWIWAMSSHDMLTKRHINLILGATIGMMAGAEQISRRRRVLMRRPSPTAAVVQAAHS